MRDKMSEMTTERGKNQSNLVRTSFSRALFYDHPFTWERVLFSAPRFFPVGKYRDSNREEFLRYSYVLSPNGNCIADAILLPLRRCLIRFISDININI